VSQQTYEEEEFLVANNGNKGVGPDGLIMKILQTRWFYWW